MIVNGNKAIRLITIWLVLIITALLLRYLAVSELLDIRPNENGSHFVIPANQNHFNYSPVGLQRLQVSMA